MSHNSHPKKCEHKLIYCSQCDIVHCEFCSEEWKKNYTNWTYTDNGTTAKTWTGSSGTMNLCNHNIRSSHTLPHS